MFFGLRMREEGGWDGWKMRKIGTMEKGLPLLNFVEAWKEWDGNKDDDCFFAMADFELCGVGQWFISLLCHRSETHVIQHFRS